MKLQERNDLRPESVFSEGKLATTWEVIVAQEIGMLNSW
jgi:hypothetical protein